MIEAGIDEVTMILLPVSELLNSPDRRWYDIANEKVYEQSDFGIFRWIYVWSSRFFLYGLLSPYLGEDGSTD